MRVAIVRGQSLNKFEMQSYEPLVGKVDIVAFHSNDNREDVSLVNIPKRELRSIEGVFGKRISGKIPLSLPLGLLGLRHYMLGLEKELEGFDIVHTAELYHTFSYQCAKAKERYGSKLVVTCWENIPFLVEDRWIFQHNFRKKIKEKVRRSADLFIAITSGAKEALILEGVKEERIRVIPVGVDLQRFKPLPKDDPLLAGIGLDRDDFVILSVCRLVWEKGVYDLLYAIKRLLMDGNVESEKVKLVLVGTNGESKGLREMARMMGIERNLILTGKIPYTDIPKVYSLADVFVLASIPVRNWKEQFGMVLIEAMACGKPIISTLCGSIPEVVGDAGILVQPNDHYSIYSKLKLLLLDESIRRHYGEKARRRVEMAFDSCRIAEKLREVYESLL